MPIRIRMSGPDSDRELGSLYAWLGDESEIRQHARMSVVAAQPGPSDMGAAFDVIQLVVDSGFQAANLALAYAAWRATRPVRPKVTIEKDGTRPVALDDTDPDIVEVIVRVLELGTGDGCDRGPVPVSRGIDWNGPLQDSEPDRRGAQQLGLAGGGTEI